MTLRLRYLGTCTLAIVGFLVWSAPAEAARIAFGEDNGGSIVWDGDSDVRTMNILSADVVSTIKFGDPSDLWASFTLTEDDDGIVNFDVVRLILSADTPNPSWLTIEEARKPTATSPELKVYDVDSNTSSGVIFDSGDPAASTVRVVAFYADLIRATDNTFQYILSGPKQTELNALLAAFPTTTFHIGLGITDRTDSLSSCNISGDCFNATASFETHSGPRTTVPEPSTLLLMGAGLVSTRFMRRRNRQI